MGKILNLGRRRRKEGVYPWLYPDPGDAPKKYKLHLRWMKEEKKKRLRGPTEQVLSLPLRDPKRQSLL